jgi:hypothetical protein
MKYTHPNYDIVINASGGYRVLEKLGWRPAREAEDVQKEEAKKEKFKQFVESHPLLDKICPICNKPFKTRSPKTRTDSPKCGQKLRRKEGR